MTNTQLKLEILESTLAKIGTKSAAECLLEEMKDRGNTLEPNWNLDYSTLLEELEGYGPVKTMFEDPRISEILINRHDELYFERDGQLNQSNEIFASPLTYERFVKRMLFEIDRVADRRHPIVDGTLEDGTRVH